MLKICVTGGRKFTDFGFIKKVLDRIKRNDIILAHGGANGVDNLCAKYALTRGWKVVEYKANWKQHKSQAGPIRNSYMLQDFKPSYLIAFPEDFKDLANEGWTIYR